MTALIFDHTPPVAGVLARARATGDGLTAALVLLGGRGWVELRELPGGGHSLRMKSPSKPELAIPETERWLLDALRGWTERGEGAPSWPGWKSALGRQAVAEKALASEQWARLERWSLIPPLARRALTPAKADAVRALDKRLRTFPNPSEPLPETRLEWDTDLAYAVALGQADGFLHRAREVNEYYLRHFQGVVMTFYTPAWYVPLRAENSNHRFAFLTSGLTGLLSGFHWSKVEVR